MTLLGASGPMAASMGGEESEELDEIHRAIDGCQAASGQLRRLFESNPDD